MALTLTNINVDIFRTHDMSAVEGLQKAGRARSVSFMVSCGEIKGCLGQKPTEAILQSVSRLPNREQNAGGGGGEIMARAPALLK